MAGSKSVRGLEKAPTGIQGFDEITQGGLPKGRPTLICGGPGSGKTMFGLEFLVHGAIRYHEPGVLMSFEETAEELTKNCASLGYDLKVLRPPEGFSLTMSTLSEARSKKQGNTISKVSSSALIMPSNPLVQSEWFSTP